MAHTLVDLTRSDDEEDADDDDDNSNDESGQEVDDPQDSPRNKFEEDKSTRNKRLAERFTEKMDSLRKKRQSKGGKRKRKSAQTDKGGKKAKSTAQAQNSNKRKKTAKPTAKPTAESTAKPTAKPTNALTFKVGSKVSGQWKGPACKGQWYDGVIKSINNKKRTAHVRYEDGDVDKQLSWEKMRVIEY